MFDITKQNIGQYELLFSSDEVKSIVEPLKEHFGITSYIYFKSFSDQSKIQLGSHPDWMVHYYENKYHLKSIFEKHPDQYEKGVIMWSELSTHDAILQAARDHGIHAGFTLINPCDDGCEFVFMGHDEHHKDLVSLQLNNIDVIERFHEHFKMKAEHLIDQAKKNPLYLPEGYEINETHNIAVPKVRDIDRRDRLINFMREHSQTPLTEKEYAVAKALLNNFTMKEIGAQMMISPRTVETHINHIKDKLGVTHKSQLLPLLKNLII